MRKNHRSCWLRKLWWWAGEKSVMFVPFSLLPAAAQSSRRNFLLSPKEIGPPDLVQESGRNCAGHNRTGRTDRLSFRHFCGFHFSKTDGLLGAYMCVFVCGRACSEGAGETAAVLMPMVDALGWNADRDFRIPARIVGSRRAMMDTARGLK